MSSTSDLLMQLMLGGQMSGANVSDMFAALAQRDPRMAALVQQMQARVAARESAAQSESVPDEPMVMKEPEIVEPATCTERGKKLKRLASTMLAELRSLRSRNDVLADALGACHLCWGEDPNCLYCAGQGRVGAYLIDPDVFEEVIGPATQQVMQRPPLAKPITTMDKGEGSHAGL